MLSVGTIINGAMRQIREHPLAMLVWGGLYTMIAVVGSRLVMQPIALAQLQGGSVSPFDTLGRMAPLYAAYLLVAVILYAAALRSTLRPDQASLASIRVGMDELRLLGVSIVLMVIFLLVALVGILILGLLIAALGSLMGGRGAGPMVAIVLLSTLAVYAAAFLVQIRLSPAVALTMLRRKIIIGEAWRLTRGNFWTLFAGYLVLGIMLAAVYLVVLGVAMGPYLSDIANNGFSPQGLRAAGQLQMTRQMEGISVMMVLGWVASAVVTGLGFAVWAGAIGGATQALLGHDGVDLEETFA